MIGTHHMKAGFSFIELTVVILIMGVLAGVGIPAVMGWVEKSRVRSTHTTISSIQQAIDLYYGEVGKYPEALDDLVHAPSDPALARKWDGPYVQVGKKDMVPQDGWSHDFYYERTPGGAHPYTLYSYGKHGEDSPEEEWISAW